MGLKLLKWQDVLAKFPKSTAEQKLQEKEKQALFEEIEEAKRDWINAGDKLDYVLEDDQIDYAIYALEAAERRYEMLLRKAKEMKFKAEYSEIQIQSTVEQRVGQVLDR